MGALYLRDLRLALRQGGGAGLGLGFYLIALSLLAFGVQASPEPDALAAGAAATPLRDAAPGALWVFATLACLLSLDRLFQVDFEDGALDQLALGPAPLEAAALAKAAAHWTTTGLPLAVAAPALGLLVYLPLEAAPVLALALLIGTPALSLIGSVAAALTVSVRRGGLLLTLLALPLYIPTLIFGSAAVRAAMEGLSPWPTLAMLGAVTLGCLALCPFAAAAALRAAMD